LAKRRPAAAEVEVVAAAEVEEVEVVAAARLAVA
jgi:hypothetical protein